MENSIKCPKCQSDQVTVNKKGFSGKKAVVGAVLVGGVGLLAGTIGSNKIVITCLNCGHQFKPGEKEIPFKARPAKAQAKATKGTWIFTKVFLIIVLFFSLFGLIGMAVSNEIGGTIIFLIPSALCILGILNANKKIKEFKAN